MKRTFGEFKEEKIQELYEEWSVLTEAAVDNFFDNRYIRIRSSNLAGMTYNFAEEVLEVDFVNGRRYQYYGVPREEFMRMIDAGSKGRYFHSNIRLSYQYAEV